MLKIFSLCIPPPVSLHSSCTGLLTVSFSMPGMLNLEYPFSQPIMYFPSFIYRLGFVLQVPGAKLILQKRVAWNFLYYVLFPSHQPYSLSCLPCFITLHYYNCISLPCTSFLTSNTQKDITTLPQNKYVSYLVHLLSTSRRVLGTQGFLNKCISWKTIAEKKNISK